MARPLAQVQNSKIDTRATLKTRIRFTRSGDSFLITEFAIHKCARRFVVNKKMGLLDLHSEIKLLPNLMTRIEKISRSKIFTVSLPIEVFIKFCRQLIDFNANLCPTQDRSVENNIISDSDDDDDEDSSVVEEDFRLIRLFAFRNSSGIVIQKFTFIPDIDLFLVPLHIQPLSNHPLIIQSAEAMRSIKKLQLNSSVWIRVAGNPKMYVELCRQQNVIYFERNFLLRTRRRSRKEICTSDDDDEEQEEQYEVMEEFDDDEEEGTNKNDPSKFVKRIELDRNFRELVFFIVRQSGGQIHIKKFAMDPNEPWLSMPADKTNLDLYPDLANNPLVKKRLHVLINQTTCQVFVDAKPFLQICQQSFLPYYRKFCKKLIPWTEDARLCRDTKNLDSLDQLIPVEERNRPRGRRREIRFLIRQSFDRYWVTRFCFLPSERWFLVPQHLQSLRSNPKVHSLWNELQAGEPNRDQSSSDTCVDYFFDVAIPCQPYVQMCLMTFESAIAVSLKDTPQNRRRKNKENKRNTINLDENLMDVDPVEQQLNKSLTDKPNISNNNMWDLFEERRARAGKRPMDVTLRRLEDQMTKVIVERRFEFVKVAHQFLDEIQNIREKLVAKAK